MDFAPAGVLGQLTVVIARRPTGRPASLSIGWPGYAGLVSGMNDAGLSTCLLLNHDAKQNPDGGSFGTWPGTVKTPEPAANLCFGDADGKTLFITAKTSLYAAPTLTQQALVRAAAAPTSDAGGKRVRSPHQAERTG